MRRHESRTCTAPRCGLRFPVEANSPLGRTCPRCGARTAALAPAYDSHQAHDAAAIASGPELELFIDNVRSVRNVGSMLRTADGCGMRHVYLGGVTPTPDHPKMEKTSLGAEATMHWTQERNGAATAARLRSEGRRLWALEGGPRSTPLFDLVDRVSGRPLVIVVGHEVAGVDPRIVEQCDEIARLPMLGLKGSLNVSVAMGIAAYWIRFGAMAPPRDP